MKIVRKAIEEPVRQVAANAGLDGAVIIDKIVKSGKVGYGYDAAKEVYCDMISSGIVDSCQSDPLRTAECRFCGGDGSDD